MKQKTDHLQEMIEILKEVNPEEYAQPSIKEIREASRRGAEQNQAEFSKEENMRLALANGFYFNALANVSYHRATLRSKETIQIRLQSNGKTIVEVREIGAARLGWSSIGVFQTFQQALEAAVKYDGRQFKN